MNETSLGSILRKLGIHDFKKQRSGWLDFHCPLAPYTHASGTDKSMSAGARIEDAGLSGWVCHACKHHGRISSLVRQVARFRGLSLPDLAMEADLAEALPALSSTFGDFEYPTDQSDTLEPLPESALVDLFPFAWEHPDARTYLRQRNIGESTASQLRLAFDDDQRRILFPVRDARGLLWGFTGRAIDSDTKPKIRDYYGLPKRRLILGEERWKPNRPILIVEGLFGYAHLIEINAEKYCNVGAILGSVMTPEKAALLAAWDSNVYLLLDNDDAGDIGLFGSLEPDGTRDSVNSAAGRLAGYVPVYIPEWPEGKQDPDQLELNEVESLLANTGLFA